MIRKSLIEDRFFIIGPLRTGSSLMSRCLDDHPEIICFCESEINRMLFPEHFIKLHWARVYRHGFKMENMLDLLDRKKPNNIESLMQWYTEAFSLVKSIYDKPQARLMGDKSPDYYKSPEIVSHFANNFPLIYTTRDPRAILRSIEAQEDQSREQRDERWLNLIENFQVWEPYLDQENILISRFEDLINHPKKSMESVYSHLGVEYSERYMEPFQRLYPERFLWTTAIDWQTGVRKAFQKEKAQIQDSDLSEEMLEKVSSNPVIQRFRERFGYL